MGFMLPLFRYVLFGMPPMPNGLAMAFELAAYGAISGFCTTALDGSVLCHCTDPWLLP